MTDTLKLEIVTPAGTVYSDNVEMVTLPGVAGQKGGYPLHVPPITQMGPGEKILRKGGGDQFIAAGEGLIESTPPPAAILTGPAIPAHRHRREKTQEAPAP